MGDVIFVDFKFKRKEFKFIDPKTVPEIIQLDACIKKTIEAACKCTSDKLYLRSAIEDMQRLLNKCMKDVKS